MAIAGLFSALSHLSSMINKTINNKRIERSVLNQAGYMRQKYQVLTDNLNQIDKYFEFHPTTQDKVKSGIKKLIQANRILASAFIYASTRAKSKQDKISFYSIKGLNADKVNDITSME